jgi:hypothetical protein
MYTEIKVTKISLYFESTISLISSLLKEAYWLACELAGQPYAFNDWAMSHWGMISGPTVSHSGRKQNQTTACAGNEFHEPGALHYLPGEEEVIMSFNGCKQVGCAQFGMRKIR